LTRLGDQTADPNLTSELFAPFMSRTHELRSTTVSTKWPTKKRKCYGTLEEKLATDKWTTIRDANTLWQVFTLPTRQPKVSTPIDTGVTKRFLRMKADRRSPTYHETSTAVLPLTFPGPAFSAVAAKSSTYWLFCRSVEITGLRVIIIGPNSSYFIFENLNVLSF